MLCCCSSFLLHLIKTGFCQPNLHYRQSTRNSPPPLFLVFPRFLLIDSSTFNHSTTLNYSSYRSWLSFSTPSLDHSHIYLVICLRFFTGFTFRPPPTLLLQRNRYLLSSQPSSFYFPISLPSEFCNH